MRIERLYQHLSIPVVMHFVAEQEFVGGRDMVIRGIGANFTRYLLPKVESHVTIAEKLAVNRVVEPGNNADLIADLGGEDRVEIALSQFFAAHALQPRGEPGLLLTNGHSNTAYVRDVFGAICAVCGIWYRGGWVFEAYPRDCPCRYSRNRHILSPW